jgi:hypothetical protein
MTTPSNTIGTITGVHGPHCFIESNGISYFASRRDITFNDPHLGLRVEFVPDRNPSGRSPLARDVRKA